LICTPSIDSLVTFSRRKLTLLDFALVACRQDDSEGHGK
jgi:hypothetical protein